MNDAPRGQKMRLRVYGQDYSVRSSQDPEHMKQVARRVDDAMRAVANGSAVVKSPTEIAVLVALHFASELTRTETDLNAVLSRMEEMTNALSHAVEDEAPALVGP